MFSGLLIGLLDKKVQVRGHLTLETTCGEGADSKTIDDNYLIVDVVSPCTIIIGRPSINALREVISTQYLIF